MENSSSLASTPFSSPNVGVLLKIRVISWSQESGLPVTVSVRAGDRTFNLHKHQLVSKSGYFKRVLSETTDHDLPEHFPGGPEAFEMLALFLYGASTMVDPFNVVSLRCAAEFLEMTEEHSHQNLCERFDRYLNQVVLQSWDDTLIVLRKCQTLLPLSEELLIVGRCIESLAFMACMEMLDPDPRRDPPSPETPGPELWIKDLSGLPFRFFKRVIGSLRRQGMRERFVCPAVVFYANKWILSENGSSNDGLSSILQGVLELLPTRDKASRVIPVGFYFALLWKSLEIGVRDESRDKLKELIVSSLHLAKVSDFSGPTREKKCVSQSLEVATMESIISRYASLSSDKQKHKDHIVSVRDSTVAGLWDSYLSWIARDDPAMEAKRFTELMERLPVCYRQNHDKLYRAMSTFLQAHPEMSQEQKGLVCKSLSCQKLSQEACIDAVQNDTVPLRLIVQALFVQQLNTHQAFKDSFRYGEQSGSLSAPGRLFSRSINPGESPLTEGNEGEAGCPEFSRKEYESTSFRIQNLEQELMALKRRLEWQKNKRVPEPFCKDGRSRSGKSNEIGQVTNCVDFASQRRCVNRLLKVFGRITLFGSRKPKRKASSKLRM